MSGTKEKAQELADAHWGFIKECLDKFSDAEEVYNYEELMIEIEWGFIHGFTYGFKHGKEDNKDE